MAISTDADQGSAICDCFTFDTYLVFSSLEKGSFYFLLSQFIQSITGPLFPILDVFFATLKLNTNAATHWVSPQ